MICLGLRNVTNFVGFVGWLGFFPRATTLIELKIMLENVVSHTAT